ncbi:cpr-6 [Symbiodinium sp. KB8]|nr:cpr-6 [Symbiodinium sp. KB8]
MPGRMPAAMGDDKARSPQNGQWGKGVAADMEVMFDMSKKEQGNPSNNYKKLHRRIKQDYKVSTNKEVINIERLRVANLVIFAGPREMFTVDEFTALKDYLADGGSILFLVGEGGEGKSNTNVNYLLEEFGMSINNDAVADGEQVLNVTADQAKMMIRVEEMDSTNTTPTLDPRPTDKMILDVANGFRHEHQRFFSETVCYTFDMHPAGGMMSPLMRWKNWPKRVERLAMARSSTVVDAARDEDGKEEPDNSSGSVHDVHEESPMNETQLRRMMFVEAMTPGCSVRQVAGLNCTAWVMNQSHSLHVKEMMQAMTSMTEATLRDLPVWWFTWDVQDASEKLQLLQSLLDPTGVATMSALFEFCVTDLGELLSAEYKLTYARQAQNATNETELDAGLENQSNASLGGPNVLTLFESDSRTQLLSPPHRPSNLLHLSATYGVTGGECVDLTQGNVGEAEMDSEVNGPERLARINRETVGLWEAAPYDFWKGLKVREIVPSLGTEIGPLRLPLRPAQPSLVHAEVVSEPSVPVSFDARAHWSKCNSIGIIRNQGRAVEPISQPVVFFSEEMQGLSLAPELLVQCDETNHGCGGGRLDDVWLFLRSHGVPQESCAPYEHCLVPTQRTCDYDWQPRPTMQLHSDQQDEEPQSKHDICNGACADGSKMKLFKVAEVLCSDASETLDCRAYAAAPPRDVVGLQRELLTHGPVEVAFFVAQLDIAQVFSDFMSYKRGVYFRTPGAFGPLGGHAVRLLGWGTEEDFGKDALDYWLIANSYSPRWGMHGLFRIRRGTNECGIESIPAAGTPVRAANGEKKKEKENNDKLALNITKEDAETVTLAKDDGGLEFVFPYGATLNAQKPAVPILSSGLLHIDMRRRNDDYGMPDSGWLTTAAHMPEDDFLDCEKNRLLRIGDCELSYAYGEEMQELQSTENEQLPRDFTQLFDDSLFKFAPALGRIADGRLLFSPCHEVAVSDGHLRTLT